MKFYILFAPLLAIVEHSVYIEIINLLVMKFNQKCYNYSIKNIPIRSKKLYKINLIQKVELYIKRLIWKAHMFESSGKGQPNPLHYVFKSRKCPPHHNDLIAFVNDLLKWIKNVTFRKVRNKFQDGLKKDIKSIKKCNNIYIFLDKTSIKPIWNWHQ